MTIEINGNNYPLKLSFRAYLLMENIQGRSFDVQNMTDMINFFYCIVLTSSKEYDFKYNDFLDKLDENPQLLVEFSQWLEAEYTKTNMLSPEPDKEEDSQKKS